MPPYSQHAMARKRFLLLWSSRILGIAASVFLGLLALDAFEPGLPTRAGAGGFCDSPRARRGGSGDRRAVVAPGLDWRSGVRPARGRVCGGRQVSPRLDPCDIRSAAGGRSAVSVELAQSAAAERELTLRTKPDVYDARDHCPGLAAPAGFWRHASPTASDYSRGGDFSRPAEKQSPQPRDGTP